MSTEIDIMERKSNKGWRHEPGRHALSSKGVKTTTQLYNAKGIPSREYLKILGYILSLVEGTRDRILINYNAEEFEGMNVNDEGAILEELEDILDDMGLTGEDDAVAYKLTGWEEDDEKVRCEVTFEIPDADSKSETWKEIAKWMLREGWASMKGESTYTCHHELVLYKDGDTVESADLYISGLDFENFFGIVPKGSSDFIGWLQDNPKYVEQLKERAWNKDKGHMVYQEMGEDFYRMSKAVYNKLRGR